MGRPNRSREAILESAAILAASRGIAAATIDEIAAHAGVAKGSVYYNFGGKDELFNALFATANEHLVSHLERVLAEAPKPRALEAVIRELLLRIQQHPHLARLLIAETLRENRDWPDAIGEFRSSMAAVFQRALQVARPQIANANASMMQAVSIAGSVLMAGFEWLAFEPARTIDEVTKDLVDLYGLQAA